MIFLLNFEASQILIKILEIPHLNMEFIDEDELNNQIDDILLDIYSKMLNLKGKIIGNRYKFLDPMDILHILIAKK